jgi:F-type H+-transporting ATPase subunit b
VILAEEVNEIWKWPNFLILAGLLGYLIRKHGVPLLQSRSEEIRQNMEAGKKAKVEAEAIAAGVQAKMANLERIISELREAAHADLEREAQRLRAEAESAMSRIEQHTDIEIGAIGKHAQLELRQYAAGLAMDLAEQKIRERMSPDVQANLLDNFAGDISSYGSQHV